MLARTQLLQIRSETVSATLFGVPASHPSLAAELMLRHKGIDYRRIDFVAAVHRVMVRALGFPGLTVPALRLDGKRVQGTREIALALDAVRPEPPLVPPEATRRRVVLAAELWADEGYQPVPRRLIWSAMKRDRSTIATYLEGAKVGIPAPIAARTAAPVVAAAARLNQATDENVRRDLAALPALIDHVDRLLGEGTIGGAELNVADFQVATTTGLLSTMADVRPLLEGRPAFEHSRRVAPGYPGQVGPVFPAAWLPR